MDDARFTVRFPAQDGAASSVAANQPHDDPAAPAILPARAWPFVRWTTPHLAASARLTLRVPDLHHAFPSGQTSGTRLVLTQATYQLQRWLDWLDAHPLVAVVADCPDPSGALRAEASAGRGPWSRIQVEAGVFLHEREADGPAWFDGLAAAFEQTDPGVRAAAAAAAAQTDHGNAAVRLALASACMEQRDFDGALGALSSALDLAPDWEAVHFEHGKLWLRADDTQRAAAAFAEALRLMPSFAVAASNLGAALAESGRPAESVPVLEQALRFDARGHTILNNLGAAYRELGRLTDAEAAFRQVIALADAFVFGHYNLAHTLFLQGRFAESRDAYQEGARRDPQRNLRQACRGEVARAAAGDGPGAVQGLRALSSMRPDGLGVEILEELGATLDALAGLPQASAADVAITRAFVRGLPPSPD